MNKLKEPTDDKRCGNCRHNIINIIFGVYFGDKRCTGTCGIAPVSGIYYNQIELICDCWEEKE
ncbi:MAG: hypothetical protein LUD12_02780 [Lachnospiraceae bacterium]|nr:hypothetical protein [Lachnospiraceae bacterium]